MSDAPQAIPFETALAKYTDEDARSIGMPTPGALNLLTVFAKQMVGTPFLPRTIFKDMAAPQASATLLAVILTGRELGFSPMQSLRAFWMSPDGRLGIYGDSMVAVMRREGFQFEWNRNDDEACDVTAKRPIKGGGWETYRSTYTVEMAKQAGLWQKERSVWPKYPARMCKWRVIGDIFRTLGPDLGGGQMYTKEELEDDLGYPSTMDEPSEADVRRGEQLAADAQRYKSGLKGKGPQAEPAIDIRADMKETTPATAAPPEPIKEEPKSNKPNGKPVDTKPKPAQATPRAAEESAMASDLMGEMSALNRQAKETKVIYGIHLVMKTGGGEEKFFALPDEPPFKDRGTAELRAQAIANETGSHHVVVGVNPETGERVGTPVLISPPASKTPAKPPAEPVAASEEATGSQTPPEAAKGSRVEENPRIAALAKILGIQYKATETRVRQFFAGYLGVALKDITTATTEQKKLAMAELEAVAQRDIDEFRSGPEQTGKRLREQVQMVDGYLKSALPKDLQTQDLIRTLSRQWNLRGKAMVTFLEFHGIRPVLSEEDRADLEAKGFRVIDATNAQAFIRMALVTREAGALTKVAQTHNLSIAKILARIEEVGKAKVESMGEEKASKLIRVFIESIEQEVAESKPPERAAAAGSNVGTEKTQGGDEQQDMFGDL